MKISVIGQGYVGLPLSLAISKKYNVIGYDINLTKIRYLKKKKIQIMKLVKVIL